MTTKKQRPQDEMSLTARKKQIRELRAVMRRLNKKLGRMPLKHEFFLECSVSEWTIRKIFGSYDAAVALLFGDVSKTTDVNAMLKLSRMESDNKALRQQIEALEQAALAGDALRSLIGNLNRVDIAQEPGWLKGSRSARATTGTPVLMLSDIHFDEVVKPEQVGGRNRYNREIGERRIKTVFTKTIELLKHHFVSPNYDGIVVPLGGDMISGNIHEELRETNEFPILKTIYDMTSLLATGIGMLADEFGKVHVPCVVGNHGRMDKKPRAKNAVQDNFEYLIYMYLAKEFRNDARVTFQIPEGSDALFWVYDKKFCLTHGNQFSGGAGISGIYTPLMLGKARKQNRQQAMGEPFDIMLLGHFHQLILMEHMVVNGSVKGYDEYAYNGNFPFERPQQALFVMNRDYGMTYRVPIICDAHEK